MSTGSSRPCTHCGTLVEDGAGLEAGDAVYCCPGCETAAAIIAAGGWDQYYAKRDGWSPRPAAKKDFGSFDDDTFRAAYVRSNENGTCDTQLRVEGIRCAACTWLLERAVDSLPGVNEVTVSYSSNAARITWDPARISLSQIAERVSALGYEARALNAPAATSKDLLIRLGVAAFCAMNVMLFAAAVYAGWFSGMEERHRALFGWSMLVISTPAALYSAEPFFQRAWQGVKARVLHIDLPIAVAIGAMYLHGLVATFVGAEAYLDSMTMLIALLLAGRVVDERARGAAKGAAEALLAEAPQRARRETATGVEEVPVTALAIDDRVILGPGAVVPTDGELVEGAGSFDRSVVSGESAPVALAVGDAVDSGIALVEGSAVMRVTAPASESLLSRLSALVGEAQDKAGYERTIADKLAPWFVAGTLLIGVATLAVWWLLDGPEAAVRATIAVLVVACPCSLALGVPATFASSLGAAARRGAFVREARALLASADVDVAVFDKTGTLTRGRLEVVEADDDVLRLAAGLERFSSHPIARAVLDEAARRRIPLPRVESVTERSSGPEAGVSGIYEGRPIALRGIGTERLALVRDGEELGEIRLRDVLRSDARRAVDTIGVPVHLCTGDRPEVAERVAASLPLASVSAGQTPDQKVARVAELQAAGHRVLFAGDGVNDAAAIARADLGVAMGHGAHAAMLSADVVVVTDDIAPIVALRRIGKLTVRAMRTNTTVAVTYNVVGVAAAALGFVNPLVAAVLMPLSSLGVLWNATRVERVLRSEEAQHGHPSHTPSPLPGAGGALRLAVR